MSSVYAEVAFLAYNVSKDGSSKRADRSWVYTYIKPNIQLTSTEDICSVRRRYYANTNVYTTKSTAQVKSWWLVRGERRQPSQRAIMTLSIGYERSLDKKVI